MMNEEDIWIIAYMTMLWKTGQPGNANKAANAALKDYKNRFPKE